MTISFKLKNVVRNIMKKFYLILLIISSSIAFLGLNKTNEKAINKSEIKLKVDELLSKMTLEEKIGQMTQVTIQVISKTEGTVDQKFSIDDDKLAEAIQKYHVGSILNVYNVAHTVEEWHSIINLIQTVATEQTRLGIPIIYGIDAIHGATYTKGATLFPQAISLAATWNRDMAFKEGTITSRQVRASGISWNYYPVMDIGRQPLWSRLWETYGEDVYLASQLGESYIKGAQGENYGAPDKLATCLKHYVGYSFPLNGRDRTPAWISEGMLREYFLPTFEAGVKAGAPTVMVNSSEINGIPTHSNYHLLTEVLKDEMGFEGFIVSDWEDIKRLNDRDRVADSPKEAVRMAVMAGVDMSMVPYDFSFYEHLLELVNEGAVPMTRIDDAVRRILTVKMQLGLFEDPMPLDNFETEFNNPEYENANLRAAQESIILTKNENSLLPLAQDTKVFLTGPTADLLSALNGGWTLTWQGNEERLYPTDENTLLEAIENKIGKENVTYAEGSTFDKIIDIEEVIKAADESDVIIACLGEPAYCESPGNINDLTLEEAQLSLVEELSKTGKPIVLVMLEGRPRLINRIVDKCDAVVIGFLPGMKGGDAIADVITGDVNPSGKLPVTYPNSPNGLMCYDYKPIEDFDVNHYTPQWPFGYGLSYTTFEYFDMKISNEEINNGDEIYVTVSVKNTGDRIGKEVVQLYLCDVFGSVSRPVKQLKGFEKVELKPGEVKQISFTITPEHLSFIGRDNKRIIEAGDFKVYVDKLEASFKLL
jgi:beta-glucosidase